jgi:hypothetical protein
MTTQQGTEYQPLSMLLWLRFATDGSPVPTRARCQELAEMPWYSDAVLTQADFGACIEVKPELQVRA